MARQKPTAPDLNWRTMLRLRDVDGAEIDRIAAREATPSATVCRRLLVERLDQLRRESKRDGHECGA